MKLNILRHLRTSLDLLSQVQVALQRPWRMAPLNLPPACLHLPSWMWLKKTPAHAAGLTQHRCVFPSTSSPSASFSCQHFLLCHPSGHDLSSCFMRKGINRKRMFTPHRLCPPFLLVLQTALVLDSGQPLYWILDPHSLPPEGTGPVILPSSSSSPHPPLHRTFSSVGTCE